ncbi:MAG: type 2 isopentenyl-diphosphate Delta-isomerase [Candidatus Thermoplasmatota archaeon]|jgi:isopentenyl-diphosphate delta-isomerase|nr:type 2 isopentenyl-diphosphate Delta-isomerase [Candidatus Thermoplasmatota archaeon]
MIANRKEEHIRIAEKNEVNASHNYWDDIVMVHRSIPEVDYNSIETNMDFLGTVIDYPILISSMTGGTELARKINRNLARAAEKFNIPMGLGSMRAAVEHRELGDTYSVINDFKIPVKLANIGAPQLIEQDKKPLTEKDLDYLIDLIGAKFLIIHFNFLQEMIQPEGDRNAKGVLKRVSEIAESYPVIAKETGAGFSRDDINDLIDSGVKAIDVGGLGGTSFAAIEYYRAEKTGDMEKTRAGTTFWNWGVPSPVSIILASGRIPVIGSGGLRNGLDLFKAISLGAMAGGFARTLLEGADDSYETVEMNIRTIIREFKIGMMLTGTRTMGEARTRSRIIKGELKDWTDGYVG